jgi:hypothetical protein
LLDSLKFTLENQSRSKLWFLSKLISLQNTFLNIPNEIKIKFPCSTRYLELVIKIYLDFDRAYLLCPEESLCVYGLDEEVDSYIDTKLKCYSPNPYQRHQIKERNIFIKGYLNRNKNSFYSRQLLAQYNINVEDPLIIGLSEDLEKKPFSLMTHYSFLLHLVETILQTKIN